MLKNIQWHHPKLAYFRFRVRIPSPLSNDNLAPTDPGTMKEDIELMRVKSTGTIAN